MLTLHHAAKAREEAFDVVGVLAVKVAVHFAVVNAASLVVHFKAIPMGSFVSEDNRLRSHASLCDFNAFRFRLANESQGAAIALAKGDNDAATA